MEVIRDARELRGHVGGAFVPTMGALHAGHAALIHRAAAAGRPVVVSIFVNPTQFAPGEDFEKYPRQVDADIALAESEGADVVFAPGVEGIYPPGVRIDVPPLPGVATQPRLEDAHRPTHFAGVCQVVARLFDLVRPRWAVFGEKDWQQLKVIEAMTAREAASGRWGDLQIVPHPTVREPDGLAMSSRNALLNPYQREQAVGLIRALDAAIKKGSDPFSTEAIMRNVLTRHGLAIDYAVVRDAATLMPLARFDRPARALIAARLGSVRLIDNAPLNVPPLAA